jgi:hypothetical protein
LGPASILIIIIIIIIIIIMTAVTLPFPKIHVPELYRGHGLESPLIPNLSAKGK